MSSCSKNIDLSDAREKGGSFGFDIVCKQAVFEMDDKSFDAVMESTVKVLVEKFRAARTLVQTSPKSVNLAIISELQDKGCEVRAGGSWSF